MIEIQPWWSELEGLSFDDARALARTHGMDIRIGSRDGKPGIVTADFRRDRLTVAIVDGKVKAKPYRVG